MIIPMRKFTTFLICFCVFTSSAGSAYATTSSNEEVSVSSIAEEYAYDVIDEFISTGDSIVTWTDATSIVSSTLLYSPSDEVNGIIFTLETDDQPNGYMQLSIIDNDWHVVNLGFDGPDYLTAMASQSDKEISLNTDEKVYYLGGFSYFAPDSDGNLISIEDDTIFDTTIQSLQSVYDAYCSNINENSTTLATATRSTTSSYYVENWSTASTYMRSMEYYKSLDSSLGSHCAPTAATNLIMYWKYAQNYFSENSSIQKDVFDWFYSAMGTTATNGTYNYKIKTALTTYTYYSGIIPTLTAYESFVLTYSQMAAQCLDDNPFILCVLKYSGDENHAINVWGYSTLSSGDYLFITNNWGTNGSNYVSFSLMNYSSYSYERYAYISTYS